MRSWRGIRRCSLLVAGALFAVGCGDGGDEAPADTAGGDASSQDSGEVAAGGDVSVVFNGEQVPVESTACAVVEDNPRVFAYFDSATPDVAHELFASDRSGNVGVDLSLPAEAGGESDVEHWEVRRAEGLEVSRDGAFGTVEVALSDAGDDADDDEPRTGLLEIQVPCPS